MKLETALDLIHEAIRIEEENPELKSCWEGNGKTKNSVARHDDCLRMARKIILDNIKTKR